MMSKIKTIIIIVVVLAIGFFAYNYFFVSNDDTSAGLKDVSETGNSPSTKTASSSKDLSQNDQYVKQLVALRGISFNFDLFNDDAYKILHAANTDIPPEEKGRQNPFAPIELGDGEYTDATSTINAVLNADFQATATSTGSRPKTLK